MPDAIKKYEDFSLEDFLGTPESSGTTVKTDDPFIEASKSPLKRMREMREHPNKVSGVNIIIPKTEQSEPETEKPVEISLLRKIYLMVFDESDETSKLSDLIPRFEKIKNNQKMLQEYYQSFKSPSFWDGDGKDWKYLITIETYLSRKKLIPDTPFINARLIKSSINKAAGVIVKHEVSILSGQLPENLLKIYTTVKKALSDCMEELNLKQ
jgi:hypothetical protein